MSDDIAGTDTDQAAYAEAAHDTLPEWLFQRFTYRMPKGTSARWVALDDDDQSYWAHEADAVRRAVARGGFK